MTKRSLILSRNINQKPDYDDQKVMRKRKTVRKKINGEEDSDIYHVKTTFLPFPDETFFLYCETCELKYEGGCPDHGLEIYIDNAEDGQDFSPFVQEADNKDRQVSGWDTVEQSGVCEPHSDDVKTVPNGDCSTKTDELFSVCEMDTGLCVAGTSCGLQSNVDIQTHQEIQNTGKTLNCDVCGRHFTNCGRLNTHKRMHTEEKPYKCDVCSVGFNWQCSLKAHKTTHTGERPYKCYICGTQFIWRNALKIHERMHTGEKPYKCNVCGKGFAQSGHLKRHSITHTGAAAPYKCGVCGAGFVWHSHLKMHKRTHTREKC